MWPSIFTPSARVDRFIDGRSILADVDHDAVQINNRIDRIERPGLPFNDLLNHRIGDFGSQPSGYLSPDHFFKGLNNLASGPALGIQEQDFVVHGGEATRVLFNQPGPEATRSIPKKRGSVGDSYDNALAETINGLYKAEVIHKDGPCTGLMRRSERH